MGKIMSLCLTTQLISENYEGHNHKTVLFRLKDVNDDAFIDHHRMNDFDEGYQESTGYKYPYTDSKNHIINELKIWEWDPFENVWATKTKRVFYELIRDHSLDHLDRNEKINELKKGIQIEKYECKPSLLVLEETEDEYFVIYIDSNILKKNGAVHKLDKNITHLKGYYLLKKDFFTTENVRVLDGNGNRYPGKIIYNFLSLHEPDEQIDVLTFEEKLNCFLRKQVKVLNLSKSERRTTKYWLDTILNEHQEIEKFFEENGWSLDNITDSIEKIKVQIDEVLSDEKLRMNICDGLIKNSDSIVNDLEKKIEEIYLTQHKKEQFKRNKELMTIDHEVKVSQEKKYELDAEIDEMKVQLKNLEEEIASLKEIDIKLSDKVREKIKKADSDIVEFLSEYMMVNNNRKEYAVKKEVKSISTCIRNSTLEEPYWIDSTTEMIDVLKSNLDSIGIDAELSYSLSNYILCSLKQGTNLSFVGKYSKLLFDCVSKSISGALGNLLYVNSIDTMKDELSDSISILDQDFVGIVDLLQKNSNLAMEILSSGLDKQLVFITLLPESLLLMDDSIFNFVNFVYTDWIFESPNLNLDCIDSSNFKSLDSINIQNDRRIMKKVKDTLNGQRQQIFKSKLHYLQKSALIALLNQHNADNALFSWIFFEMLPSMIQNGNEYDEILNNLDISDKHLRFIEENIW